MNVGNSVLISGGLLWIAISTIIRAEELPTRSGVAESEASEGEPAEQSDRAMAQASMVLAPYVVTAVRWKLPLRLFELGRLELHSRLQVRWPSGSFVTTPERAAQPARSTVYPVTVLDGDVVRASPCLRSEDALAADPTLVSSRSLAGMSGRSAAAQASLRGMGTPLALVDGIPVNDPWDGSIRWQDVPVEGLDQTEVAPGAGAVPWGGPAGGVIQFLRVPAIGQLVTVPVPADLQDVEHPFPPKQVVVGAGRATVLAGDEGTRSAEIAAIQPTRLGVLQILGRAYHTDGSFGVAPEQRGAIDARMAAQNRWLETRWRQPLGRHREVTAAVRADSQSDELGTEYQQAGSHGRLASLTFAGETGASLKWNGIVYVQARHGRRTFSTVDIARTSEMPYVDTFDLNSTTWGASWTGVWRHSGGNRTTFGLDARSVKGESKTDWEFASGSFAHERAAGGAQKEGGVFVLHHRQLGPSARLTSGLRAERWQESGSRRETDRSTGAQLWKESISPAETVGVSPTAGIVWEPWKQWRLRATGQTGYRRPTLAVRYELFGLRSVVTEPCAALRPERQSTLQIAAEYRPRPGVVLHACAFAGERRDAIGTRAIVRGAGEFPEADRLPAGYEMRTWTNFDCARVQGVELSARWTAIESLTIAGGLLLCDARIRDMEKRPWFEGNLLAGIPTRSGVLTATWHPSVRWALHNRIRLLGRQFVDEENTRRLGEAALLDLGINYSYRKGGEVFLIVENAADARVIIDRGVTGLTYLGSRRLAAVGMRVAW